MQMTSHGALDTPLVFLRVAAAAAQLQHCVSSGEAAFQEEALAETRKAWKYATSQSAVAVLFVSGSRALADEFVSGHSQAAERLRCA